MAYEINWSKRAVKNLAHIIDYLQENWPESVAINFNNELRRKLNLISDSYNIGPTIKSNKFKRSILITKHTRMFYRVEKDKIMIVTLFDTRQNPKKLKTMGLAEPIFPYGETV